MRPPQNRNVGGGTTNGHVHPFSAQTWERFAGRRFNPGGWLDLFNSLALLIIDRPVDQNAKCQLIRPWDHR